MNTLLKKAVLLFSVSMLVGAQTDIMFDARQNPNATAVADYTGPLRPQIHFTPPTEAFHSLSCDTAMLTHDQDFMNDPNGCFLDANGTWHLYYQYNPSDVVAGNQHWGHATSKDLYHWENQAIAIYPPDNTSQVSVQELAYSHDGGYTFTRYEGNPVLDVGSAQFRDPKVIWHEGTSRWVAVIAYAQQFVVGMFTNFSHYGLLGLQYECPNLRRRSHGGMYLLTISINPGAPLGGSTTQYFPGTFNGTHFVPVDGAARIADFGKDNYAGQFFYGTPEGELPYTAAVPTAQEGWRSAMTVPRQHYLTKIPRVGWDLVQLPYNLTPVLGEELGFNNALVNASLTVDFADLASNAVYLEVNVSGPSAFVNGKLSFAFRAPSSGEALLGGCTFIGQEITCYLDRGKTLGFDDPFFTDKVSVGQVPNPSGEWSMAAIFDRSIIEVFLDGGIYSGTATFFPQEPLTLLEVSTTGMPEDALISARVTALKSGWEASVEE
ncbi:glycosyl hydrolase [Schizophyllum amplum]|uniref:Glycosyl hydrolase n=1 Tax=Schizophyllum amplum TaxID=97359 RepID=A0A550CMA9_9AGAR|nr:glycosyl hydrolase [Auriculariopsis ampla]